VKKAVGPRSKVVGGKDHGAIISIAKARLNANALSIVLPDDAGSHSSHDVPVASHRSVHQQGQSVRSLRAGLVSRSKLTLVAPGAETPLFGQRALDHGGTSKPQSAFRPLSC